MEIILIAAMAANRVIGRDGDIPWRIPGEQQRFQKITMGHVLVMGRKTFESIGRPLPGRRTVIISRQPDYRAQGCTVVHSLEAALAACRDEERVFIAGGGAIYDLALPLADAIYLTVLEREVEGDAFFPRFSEDEFAREHWEEVNEGGEPYTFVVYRRRRR